MFCPSIKTSFTLINWDRKSADWPNLEVRGTGYWENRKHTDQDQRRWVRGAENFLLNLQLGFGIIRSVRQYNHQLSRGQRLVIVGPSHLQSFENWIKLDKNNLKTLLKYYYHAYLRKSFSDKDGSSAQPKPVQLSSKSFHRHQKFIFWIFSTQTTLLNLVQSQFPFYDLVILYFLFLTIISFITRK